MREDLSKGGRGRVGSLARVEERRWWCSGEGDRCTVPGHTAMPESAFREHWPPALRLRSLCRIEKGGGEEERGSAGGDGGAWG